MTAFALARRTGARFKLRAALAVAGVAIIGALNFDMILLSRGLLLSFADLIDSAGFDVRVTGGNGVPALRLPIADAAALVRDIRRLPEVESAALVRFDQAFASVPGGPGEEEVTLVGTTAESPRGGWTIVRGAALDQDGTPAQPEVIVTRLLAAAFGLEPGSLVRLRAAVAGERSALPAVECRVVGVGEFAFEAAGEHTVATTLQGFDRVRGEASRDEADGVLVASRPEAGAERTAAAISRLRKDLRAFSNAEVLSQFNRNGFAYFRQISLVLQTTTAVFTVLLVATLLTVSVNQRLGEIAGLRAIGMAGRRVAAMLLWESGLLVGAGGLLALPLGGALAAGLDALLRRMPGLPERLHFFVFEPRALAVHALLLAATAVVAAAYPMWLAVRLPIAETLRREVVS